MRFSKGSLDILDGSLIDVIDQVKVVLGPLRPE